MRTIAELDEVDALALPGGESTTMSRLLRVFGLAEPLGDRIAAGLPCFATCAGMILMSSRVEDGRPDQLSYGAVDIGVRRNGYGRQRDSFEAQLAVPSLGTEPFPAVFIRAPRVEAVGPGVEVLAELEGDPVVVAQGAVLAFCFHPEMAGDLRFHDLFLERARSRTAVAE